MSYVVCCCCHKIRGVINPKRVGEMITPLMGITVTLSDGQLKTEDIDPNEKVASLMGRLGFCLDKTMLVTKCGLPLAPEISFGECGIQQGDSLKAVTFGESTQIECTTIQTCNPPPAHDEAAMQKDVASDARRKEIFGDPDELNSVTPRSSSRLLPPHMRTTARAVQQDLEQVGYHSPDMNCLAKDMSFLAAEFLQETSPHTIGELPATRLTSVLC